jgi:hypothetical protein
LGDINPEMIFTGLGKEVVTRENIDREGKSQERSMEDSSLLNPGRGKEARKGS